MRTLIIAEAGVNHNGDVELAKELVKRAAEAGADIVKFQSFVTSSSIAVNAVKAAYQIENTGVKDSQYEMVRKLELSRENHNILLEECKLHNIEFLSTAFDNESFDFLVKLGIKKIKIASGEITNIPLLRHFTRIGNLPILLSTGMCTLGEIEDAIKIIELSGTPRKLITLLHCTTEYPAPYDEVNLSAIRSLSSAFGVKVGYSDHTLGIEIPIAAVAIGATVIEKHLTLDRNLPGPDHKASLEPHEFRAMVAGIRNVEVAMGDGIKRPTKSELRNIHVVRKYIVARRKIFAGELFTEDNLCVKRGSPGISPILWDEVIGKPACRDFFSEEPIVL